MRSGPSLAERQAASGFGRSPTWHEGYQARSKGWSLPAGHSPAYIEGWLYRDNLEREVGLAPA